MLIIGLIYMYTNCRNLTSYAFYFSYVSYVARQVLGWLARFRGKRKATLHIILFCCSRQTQKSVVWILYIFVSLAFTFHYKTFICWCVWAQNDATEVWYMHKSKECLLITRTWRQGLCRKSMAIVQGKSVAFM